MSAKYGISGRMRWEFGSEVRLADHILFDVQGERSRWDSRTPADSVSPEHAFENSIDVSVICENLKDGAGDIPDRARYFYEITPTEAYGVVFLIVQRNDGTDICKTVYRMSSIEDKPTRAYLQAYNTEFL